MERHDVVQELLNTLDRPRYLEIGVDKGYTFHLLRAAQKVAVDPVFSFDVAAAKRDPQNGNCSYFPVTSDDYFAEHSQDGLFDAVYIDGLHTFEQTLRDFLNAASVLREGGVIVIDDVIPSSFAASLPDLARSRRLWEATANPDGSWMGDVYKLIFFIDRYLPAYSFATVAENHGQTIVWRAARKPSPSPFADIESICRATFVDVVLSGSIFRIRPFAKIVAEFVAQRSAR